MSWFRNLSAYRLNGWKYNATFLSEALASRAFVPCGDLDAQSVGFVPPVPSVSDDLAHAIATGHIFLAMVIEKRNLPKQVIDRKTAERCRAMEDQQGFRVGRKQMREIRESVLDELLPRAFTTRSTTRIMLSPRAGWLIIDGKGDEALRALIKAIDKFPVESLHVARSPRAAMTEWLAADEAPANFTVDNETELQANGEGKATVKFVRHSLDVEHTRQHIAGGKQCTRLAMTWADRVSFVLTESLELKRVTPLDVLKEANTEQDEAERAESDLALMAGEFDRLLADLVGALA
jgi:recombination associated protein RdgC